MLVPFPVVEERLALQRVFHCLDADLVLAGSPGRLRRPLQRRERDAPVPPARVASISSASAEIAGGSGIPRSSLRARSIRP